MNYAYQVNNPIGQGAESDEFKRYMRNLVQFMAGFDFVRMHPDISVVAGGLTAGESYCRVLANPGKQYAVYIHHSTFPETASSYKLDDRSRALDLVPDLPRGSYRVEWVQPTDFTVSQTQMIRSHAGGEVNLETSPKHVGDIALRIVSATP